MFYLHMQGVSQATVIHANWDNNDTTLSIVGQCAAAAAALCTNYVLVHVCNDTGLANFCIFKRDCGT